MKAYSLDLRKRVIEAYIKEKEKKVSIAKRFKVSRKTVGRWIKAYEEVGRVAPKPHGGGNPGKLGEKAKVFFSQLLEKKPDLTLVELKKSYFRKYKISVSLSAISCFVRKHGFSVKKNTTKPGKRTH